MIGGMGSGAATVTVAGMHPSAEPARLIIRAYLDDVVGRYHGRKLSNDELACAVDGFPNDDLVPPTGLLLVGQREGTAVGCAGLRLLADGVGEVTRVSVLPSARGAGLGARLMREVELRARQHGVRELRLDTRHDLVEAHRLFRRVGYEEVPRFNDAPYAERWFLKHLA